jgi:hypothetical protein
MGAMKTFACLVKNISFDSIHLLLSKWFVDAILSSFSRPNSEKLVYYARLSISSVIDRINSSATASIAYKVLLKFILPPGDMMVEKITGTYCF